MVEQELSKKIALQFYNDFNNAAVGEGKWSELVRAAARLHARFIQGRCSPWVKCAPCSLLRLRSAASQRPAPLSATFSSVGFRGLEFEHRQQDRSSTRRRRKACLPLASALVPTCVDAAPYIASFCRL